MSNTEKLVVSHNTVNGYAIGIVSNIAFGTGKTYFDVVRMNGSSRYVSLTRHDNEADARTSANREWSADMAAAS